MNNAIKNGKEQSDFTVILVHEDMKLDDAIRHAKGKLKRCAGKQSRNMFPNYRVGVSLSCCHFI
jgi:hypothetical protein